MLIHVYFEFTVAITMQNYNVHSSYKLKTFHQPPKVNFTKTTITSKRSTTCKEKNTEKKQLQFSD